MFLRQHEAFQEEVIITRLDLEQCWNKLSERQQQCLSLQMGGRSRQEIADRLGVGVQTVKEHLKVGRRTLRECLEGKRG
jgi:RNA polymerase sigma factor (sigma-70 family)